LVVSWNETNLKLTFTTGKEEEIFLVCMYSTDNVGKIQITKKRKNCMSCGLCDFLMRLCISYVKKLAVADGIGLRYSSPLLSLTKIYLHVLFKT
jgi:ferredoxin-like protein FixX